ncbi:amidohydrolase family protein [Kribbella sp. NPDC054772]
MYLDGDPATDDHDRRNGVPVSGAPDRGLRMLVDHGITIIHCPLTSLRYGVALRSFGRLRNAGVRIALGTDSFPPDLIRGIDVGSNVAKVIDGALDAAPVEDYVRAATLAGADALERPDLGRIAVGATADLTAFGFDDFRDGVLDDPVRTLIMNGHARGARLTMIGGRIVMRDGQLPGFDLAALRAEAQELFDHMRAAYGPRAADGSDLFPPTFVRATAGGV